MEWDVEANRRRRAAGNHFVNKVTWHIMQQTQLGEWAETVLSTQVDQEERFYHRQESSYRPLWITSMWKHLKVCRDLRKRGRGTCRLLQKRPLRWVVGCFCAVKSPFLSHDMLLRQCDDDGVLSKTSSTSSTSPSSSLSSSSWVEGTAAAMLSSLFFRSTTTT